MNELINNSNIWGESHLTYFYGDAINVNGCVSSMAGDITGFRGCTSHIRGKLHHIKLVTTDLDIIQEIFKDTFNAGAYLVIYRFDDTGLWAALRDYTDKHAFNDMLLENSIDYIASLKKLNKLFLDNNKSK